MSVAARETAPRHVNLVPTPSPPAVTVVIPIYNEEESIPALYTRLVAALDALGLPYELIAVDDGSRDRSFALLRERALLDPRLRVVRLRRNFGQTAAFAAGFERAQGAVVVTIDADLQNDPADIGKLLGKIDEGFDVVSGWRIHRQDRLVSRKLPSALANRLISQVTGLHLHDYGCSLKAYRREVVQDLQLYGELHRFIPAIASWQGVAVTELPVNHAARQWGKSKYGISRTLRVIFDLLTVRFLLSYATRPMQIFGLVACICGLVGGAILTYLTGLKLLAGAAIADRPLLLLGVLLVVLAAQFISIGLLGEMIVRAHGTQRAAYRVREELNAER